MSSPASPPRAPVRPWISWRWIALLLLAAGSLLPVAAQQNQGAVPAPYPLDRVLVAFKEQAPLAARAATVARLGLQPAGQGSPYFAELKVNPRVQAPGAGQDPVKATLQALRRDPTVRIAEPDYRVRALAIPNDTRFGEQWGLHNVGQSWGVPDADVDAPEAWDLTTGSPSIIVAVIDTGVDHTHPDLRDNILRDAGGAVVGFDFANNDADPRDDNDHGTHVAGIVGAVGNNATGVTGVCQRVRLMPLKFLDAGGGGEISDAIRCIDFARMNGARIMNNSWGGGSPSALLQEAVRRARDAGILFVAAAGNDGANNDVVESVPANLNAILSNVLSVGATTRDDSLASFSNFGARSVDLAAPGDEILSTTPGNTYSVFSGTSMSTPLVSGAAALILARLPGLSLEQLKQRILATVDRPAALNGVVRTGRLNVRNALEEDNVAPGAPTGLAVTHVSSSGMRVSWTASGDDEGVGTASAYDLRFSRSPITPDNFAAAAPVPTTPLPEAAGTPQSTLIANLEPGAAYHLALRALDNVGNPSPLVIAGPASTRAVTCLLQDDGEGTPLFSGPAPWAVTTEKRASPSHSYTDSPGALYGNMLNLALTQTTAVNSPAETARLAFQASLDLEAGFDFLLVEGSGDGGRNWVELDRLTGTSDFKGYSYALSLLGGSALRVRFRLVTDASVVGNGVWLDDIRICTTPTPELRLSDNAEAAGLFAATSPWAITAEQSVSPTQSYSDSPRGNYRNWVDVSITQNTPARLDNILADLTFQVQTDLEPGFDFLHVELSTDGGANWQRLHLLTGRQGWNPVSLSLARFFGTAVRIRFRLTSDSSVVGDGAYVDDIQIRGEALVPLGEEPPPPDPPAAPVDLRVTTPPAPGGKTQLTLNWTDRSSDESSFRVERSLEGRVFEEIGVAPANTTNYTDTGLAPGTQYTYRVRAANPGGNSPYTEPASGRTIREAPGKISITPTRLSFGIIRLNRTGRKTVTIRNTGTGVLEVVPVAPTAPFGLGEVVQPLIVLQPGQRRQLPVVFAPTQAGTANAVLELTSNDPGRPRVPITLTGRGR